MNSKQRKKLSTVAVIVISLFISSGFKSMAIEDRVDKNLSQTADQEESSETQKDEFLKLSNKAKQELAELLETTTVYGVSYGSNNITLYKDAERSEATDVTLTNGYQIFLEDVCVDEEGILYKVLFSISNQEYSYYIDSENAIFVEEAFLTLLSGWKTQLNQLSGGDGKYSVSSIQTTSLSSMLLQFPASYRTYIKKLYAAHPNWIFVPEYTGLNWNTVIKNEMYPLRNLVSNSNIASWKLSKTGYYNVTSGAWIVKSAPYWVQASTSVTKYYLDPRNFINETSIFQFELQTYNSSYHTLSGVKAILKGTFMESKKINSTTTYAEAFMKIGKELNVSPYFLASKVKQEQGIYGTSELISGNVSGYTKYYNYYNIKASGATRTQIVTSGLAYAKSQGWSSRYKALKGGAKVIASNYIYRGQDTLYLQKFDVDSSDGIVYSHQYMQNLEGANNESKSVKTAYSSIGRLDSTYIFKIPVYSNMTTSAVSIPTKDIPDKTTISSVTSKGYNSIKISWKKVSRVSGYYIYRKKGKNGTYKRVAAVSGSSTLTYTDKKLQTDKTYYYKIKAYTKLEGTTLKGKASKALYAKTKLSTTSFTGESKVKSKKAVLVWKKISGATGYELYKSTNGGKTYKRLKTLKSGSTLTYTNSHVKSGKAYYYKVRSYRIENGKKYYSSFSKAKKLVI